MRARNTRTRSYLAAAALTTAAVLGLAAPASAAEVVTYPYLAESGVTVVSGYPNYEIEVSCLELPVDTFVEFELVAVPSGSLSVTFDCLPTVAVAGLYDETLGNDDPAYASVPQQTPGESSLVVEMNTNNTLAVTTGLSGFGIVYVASLPHADPNGELLATEVVTIPANGVQQTNFAAAGGLLDPICAEAEGDRVYQVLEFTVVTGGEHTFRIVEVSPQQTGDLVSYGGEPEFVEYAPNPWGDYMPIQDPYAFLYEGSFDPMNPAAGLIDCNDDSVSIQDAQIRNNYSLDSSGRFLTSLYSEIVVDLEPGEYSFVLTTLDIVEFILTPGSAEASNDTASDFSAAAYSVVDLPAMSGTVEIWGPQAELAATGPTSVAPLAVFGALFALAGAAVLAIRRRVLVTGSAR